MTSHVSSILEFHYLVVSTESDVNIKRNGPWIYFIIKINNNLVTGTTEVWGKGGSTPFHDACDCGQLRTVSKFSLLRGVRGNNMTLLYCIASGRMKLGHENILKITWK